MPTTLDIAVDGAKSVTVAQDKPAQTGYPLPIWLLVVGSSLVRAAGFAYPFLAYHVAGRGHGSAVVGAVLAAFGVGWVSGQLVCGWLVDRIGGRATLIGAMLWAAVMLALLAGAPHLPSLVIAAALSGLVFDAANPVIGAAIAELIPDPARRAKVDGWRYGWANIGFAASGAIGALLADWVGTAVLFWINAAACGAFALAAGCLPWGSSRHGKTEKPGYRLVFRDRRLVLLLVSSLATMTAFMGFYAVMPMLMGAGGLGVSAFGWVRLSNALAVIVLTPLITKQVSQRITAGPRLDILAAASVWMAIVMGAIAVVHTTVGFCVIGAALAPGEIVWFVVGTGIVHRIAPDSCCGRYYGIWSMAVAIAAVAAPILASCSLACGGRPVAAAATAVVGLFGAAVCVPLAHALAQ
ncbi:MAG: MFS transporter [Mycobacteriaceae bacterium]|nr:MFS transporter [Mycobacteriaceae bacterium]